MGRAHEVIAATYWYESGEGARERAAAEKARAVKAQVLEAFIAKGMAPADAAEFVRTMPQCLIDEAQELEGEEGSGSASESASESGGASADGWSDASDPEAEEAERAAFLAEAEANGKTKALKAALLDECD